MLVYFPVFKLLQSLNYKEMLTGWHHLQKCTDIRVATESNKDFWEFKN